MKTYSFKFHGMNFKLALEKSQYQNDTLAVIAYDVNEGEEFAVITVNLEPYDGNTFQSDKRAFVDENNCQGITAFLEENGLAKRTGITSRSGFCTYELMEFDTDKF